MAPSKRLLAWSAGLLAAFSIVAGAVHVPAVQSALGWRDADGNAHCPFGHDTPRPAIAIVHQPALGFVLGRSNERDVEAWARGRGVQCTRPSRRPTIECVDVPGHLIGHPDSQPATVWVELAGTVVRSIRVARSDQHVGTALRAMTAIQARLEAQLGQPARATGAIEPATVAGLLHQVAREYHADQYRAAIRVTNMGEHFLVTESYAAL